jgi:hypothetical protein
MAAAVARHCSLEPCAPCVCKNQPGASAPQREPNLETTLHTYAALSESYPANQPPLVHTCASKQRLLQRPSPLSAQSAVPVRRWSFSDWGSATPPASWRWLLPLLLSVLPGVLLKHQRHTQQQHKSCTFLMQFIFSTHTQQQCDCCCCTWMKRTKSAMVCSHLRSSRMDAMQRQQLARALCTCCAPKSVKKRGCKVVRHMHGMSAICFQAAPIHATHRPTARYQQWCPSHATRGRCAAEPRIKAHPFAHSWPLSQTHNNPVASLYQREAVVGTWRGTRAVPTALIVIYDVIEPQAIRISGSEGRTEPTITLRHHNALCKPPLTSCSCSRSSKAASSIASKRTFLLRLRSVFGWSVPPPSESAPAPVRPLDSGLSSSSSAAQPARHANTHMHVMSLFIL